MREIKFRARDLVRNECVFWDEIKKSNSIFIWINAHNWGDKNISLEQYIGRNDENDVPIYENDVVENNGRRCRVEWFSSVAYCGWDLAYISGGTHDNVPNTDRLFDGWKVIGNIYEVKD